MKKIIIIIVVVVCVLAFVGVGILITVSNSSKNDSTGIIVETDVAQSQDVETVAESTGTVTYKDETTVYPSNNESINKVNVKVGDNVKKGDVLLTYDTSALDDLNDQLADAKLNVNAANTNLKQAQLSLDSAKLPPSKSEIDTAKNNVTAAENQVSDTQSQIDQTNLSITQSEQDLNTTQSNLANYQTLYDSGIVSKTDLDNAQTQENAAQNKVDTLNSELNAEKTSLANAQKNLDTANDNYNDLVNDVPTKEKQNTIDKAQTTVDSAQVTLQQANLSVEQLQRKIDEYKTEEVSPIDGDIVTSNVIDGGIATTGTQLFTIADPSYSNMVIDANVPQRNAGELALGEKVHITGNSLGDNVIDGTVTKILPQASQVADASQGTTEVDVTVEVTPDPSDELLMAGMTLKTNIVLELDKGATVIPVVAATSDPNGQYYVYVVNDDNTVTKTNVTLGTFVLSNVEVTGIDPGQTIVINPPADLTDGSKIRQTSLEQQDESGDSAASNN